MTPDTVAAKKALRKVLRALLSALPAGDVAAESAAVTRRLVARPEWRGATRVAAFCSMPGEFDTRPLLEAAFAARKRVFLPRARAPSGTALVCRRGRAAAAAPPRRVRRVARASTVHGIAAADRRPSAAAASPRVRPQVEDVKTRKMSVVEAFSLADVDSFPKSNWNIPEPPRDGPPRADALEVGLDLVVVPGLAFDADGGRLGQGAGFYDAFLDALEKAAAPSPSTIGVGLALQHLPSERDELPDRVPREAHDRVLDVVLGPGGA